MKSTLSSHTSLVGLRVFGTGWPYVRIDVAALNRCLTAAVKSGARFGPGP